MDTEKIKKRTWK